MITREVDVENATLEDVARGVNDVHRCLEEHRVDMDKLTAAQDVKLEEISARQKKMAEELGVIPKPGTTKPKRTILTMTPWEMFKHYWPHAGALVLFYQIMVQLWPALMVFISALNHAILSH